MPAFTVLRDRRSPGQARKIEVVAVAGCQTKRLPGGTDEFDSAYTVPSPVGETLYARQLTAFLSPAERTRVGGYSNFSSPGIVI